MTNVAGISTHSVPGDLWAPLQRVLDPHQRGEVLRAPSVINAARGRTIRDDLRYEGLLDDDGYGYGYELTPQAVDFARYLAETREERERTGMLRPGEEDL